MLPSDLTSILLSLAGGSEMLALGDDDALIVLVLLIVVVELRLRFAIAIWPDFVNG